MNRFLLSLGVCFSLSSSVWAVSDSPAPKVPIISPPDWSLEVQEPRVAAGALADVAHQSAFVVRALDVKGQPLAGLPVELPDIWNDKGEPQDRAPKSPNTVLPRVEWLAPGKTAFTDINGEVRGLFTSGNRLGSVSLHGPGETRARIEQVWHDNPAPLAGSFKLIGYNSPLKTRCELYLQRGNKKLPICGHHLQLMLTAIVLWAWKVDESGKPDPKSQSFDWVIERPKRDAPPEEQARWETVSKWVTLQSMVEISPGVHEGSIIIPQFGLTNFSPIIDGVQIFKIKTLQDRIVDLSVFTQN